MPFAPIIDRNIPEQWDTDAEALANYAKREGDEYGILSDRIAPSNSLPNALKGLVRNYLENTTAQDKLIDALSIGIPGLAPSIKGLYAAKVSGTPLLQALRRVTPNAIKGLATEATEAGLIGAIPNTNLRNFLGDVDNSLDTYRTIKLFK